MNSFIPWIKKEITEGARSYRFLILAVTAAFFAFMDPIMLRMLPLIMKAQVGADLSSLIPASRDFAFATFLGDLFEIQTFVVCLVLGGIVVKERRGRVFVIPFVKGAALPGIILAKAAAYSAFLVPVSAIAIVVSYFYSGLIFPGSGIDLGHVVRTASVMAGYFVYLVALAVAASCLLPTAISATLTSLAVAYALPALGSVLKIDRFLPSFLALGAPLSPEPDFSGFAPAALAALAAIVIFITSAVAALRRSEQY